MVVTNSFSVAIVLAGTIIPPAVPGDFGERKVKLSDSSSRHTRRRLLLWGIRYDRGLLYTARN